MIRTVTGGNVRVLTLDRPERRNALTRSGLNSLADAVEDSEAPVIYLHGAGEAFCSGADLDIVAGLDPEQARLFAEQGQQVARALETFDGAVVAGIDGAARGGGLELALACDLRVCTPDATLAATGVRIGLFGAWGGTARLPAAVGRGAAMDIALSGRTIGAEEALELGLVSRVLEDPRCVADELADTDHRALRALKGLFRNGDSDGSDRETQERREREAFADLIGAFDPGRPDGNASGNGGPDDHND